MVRAWREIVPLSSNGDDDAEALIIDLIERQYFYPRHYRDILNGKTNPPDELQEAGAPKSEPNESRTR